MRAAINRAGVMPWKGLWQTLRSSCEKEMAMIFPQYAVSKWIGHSIEVNGRHYTNGMPDELFDRAAKGLKQAAQNPAQSATGTPVLSRKESSEPEAACSESGDIQRETAMCDALPYGANSDKMETNGFEPSTFALRIRCPVSNR